jgi:integrase
MTFIRAKTKNTKKGSQQAIRVPITRRAMDIINKWKSQTPNSLYLFPFLRDGLTPIQEQYYIQDFIKRNNKYMDIIRLRLGI